MHKLILIITLIVYPINLFAEQPKDWQLGFQKAASGHMEDLVWFHDYMLLPIITTIITTINNYKNYFTIIIIFFS